MENPELNDTPSINLTENLTDNSKYKPKDIPIESIIEYRKKGLKMSEIGKLLGCDHSNISRRLQLVEQDLDNLDAFKLHRADILALNGRKLLSHITQEKLEKAPLGTLVLAACQLYDKERLERGQSTNNQAILIDTISKIKALEDDNTS